MPFRQTIAAKIFGLAIILLLLTIALAGFLLYEVTRTKQDLTVVANFDVPLTQSLARLHEFGLRRRLAFNLRQVYRPANPGTRTRATWRRSGDWRPP
jgi:cytochrome b561